MVSARLRDAHRFLDRLALLYEARQAGQHGAPAPEGLRPAQQRALPVWRLYQHDGLQHAPIMKCFGYETWVQC